MKALDIANRLRETTEAMANVASVDLDLWDRHSNACLQAAAALVDVLVEPVHRKFKLGDHICKTKGSSWIGHVVGFYSTELTPAGYAVESSRERGLSKFTPKQP